MSNDSNGVESKTKDQVDKSEEEDMSKCKKIKISSNEAQREVSNENENCTKVKSSDAFNDESTDAVLGSNESSENNSEAVVSNLDDSTNKSDNISNKSEKDKIDSGIDCNNENSELKCTDTNVDAASKSTDSNADVANKSTDSNTDAANKCADPNLEAANDQTKCIDPNPDAVNNQTKCTDSNADPANKCTDLNSDTSNKCTDLKLDVANDQIKCADSNPDAANKCKDLNSDAINDQTKCTDSNSDSPKQSSESNNSDIEKTEKPVTYDDNETVTENSDITKTESESAENNTESFSQNEEKVTTQSDSDVINDESKISEKSPKNGQESLYEILNTPMDVDEQEETSVKSNGKSDISAALNGSSDQGNNKTIQDESVSIEIKRNDEITCKELLEILQEKDKKIKKKVLIIDVRNEDDYCESRMSFHDNIINIPSEKIQENKVPGYYRYILLYNIEAEKKFTRRSHYDIIVLVDKNSELKTMDSKSKIAIFKHSLEEYDVHIDYKRIAVLNGGFDAWSNLNPDFVTKS